MTRQARPLSTWTAALAMVSLLASACSDDKPTAGTEPRGTGDPGASDTSQATPEADASSLQWTDAGDGFETATVDVPLDYSKPDGAELPISVVRHRATGPASEHLGALVLQPGGPGGSGVDFVLKEVNTLPEDLTARFDIVGYDNRGVVGYQVPSEAPRVECWTNEEYAKAVDTAKGAPGADAPEQALASARAFLDACQKNSAELLPHLGTGNVVRDLDRIREALGEEQITFFGESYGTAVGLAYAAAFPDRVRAMALDGVYDPEMYANDPHASARQQAIALDAALQRFLDWADETGSFGDGDARTAFVSLLRELDAVPVEMGDDRQSTGFAVAVRVMFKLNDGRAGWPALAEGLRMAAQRDPGSPLLRPPSPESFNFTTPNAVVTALDAKWPANPDLYKAEFAKLVADAPLLGPAIAAGPPYYDHGIGALGTVLPPQLRQSPYPVDLRAADAVPLMLVGTTGDPDTPIADFDRLAEKLQNETAVTFTGADGKVAGGHKAFDRSDCVRAAVTEHLVSGQAAGGDIVCFDVSQEAASRSRAAAPRTSALAVPRTLPGPPARTPRAASAAAVR